MKVVNLLSPEEEAEFAALTAWFLATAPPTDGLRLGKHRVITDAALWWGFWRAKIEAGPVGQEKRAALAVLMAVRKVMGSQP